MLYLKHVGLTSIKGTQHINKTNLKQNNMTKKTDAIAIQYTDEQLAQIDQESGYQPPQVTPVIKFNAKEEEGKFYKTTGKRNEETGTSEFEEIEGDSISVHIISSGMKQISSGMKYKDGKISSGEVGIYDQVITLKDEMGNVVARGKYKQIQKEHPEWYLGFSAVLYLFYEDKPYKMYLSGSKAFSFSDYKKKMGRLNLNLTTITKDELVDSGFESKNWRIKFEKGAELEFDLIMARIKDINEYLKSMNSNTIITEPVPEDVEDVTPTLEEAPAEGEFKTEDIPF